MCFCYVFWWRVYGYAVFFSLDVLVVVVCFVVGLCSTVLCLSALVSVVLLVVFPLGVFSFLLGGVWKKSSLFVAASLLLIDV